MISKTCGYGIRGVVLLAVKCRENRKIGIAEIASELDVPQHFMGKILQDLVRKGIIHSFKGPNGGFFAREDIFHLPVIKVVEAIDGLEILKKCYLGREECSESNPCPLHAAFSHYRAGIIRTFQDKTIGDLTEDVNEGISFLKF